jgi:hypothetical protein
MVHHTLLTQQPIARNSLASMQIESSAMAVFRTISSAAEHQNHRMLALQVRKLAALRSVICQFVIRKECAGNNVGSHG